MKDNTIEDLLEIHEALRLCIINHNLGSLSKKYKHNPAHYATMAINAEKNYVTCWILNNNYNNYGKKKLCGSN